MERDQKNVVKFMLQTGIQDLPVAVLLFLVFDWDVAEKEIMQKNSPV